MFGKVGDNNNSYRCSEQNKLIFYCFCRKLFFLILFYCDIFVFCYFNVRYVFVLQNIIKDKIDYEGQRVCVGRLKKYGNYQSDEKGYSE